MDSKRYLKVGKMVGTRGISGEIKVKHFCDTVKSFCSIKNFCLFPNVRKLDIINKRILKNIVLIRINGLDTIEDVQQLIGKDIYSHRDDISLPKGRYFVDDILGMDVIDINTNIIYGKIYNVVQNGAHDVYCIKDTNFKEYFLPAVNEMIDSINVEKNAVYVSPIKGIFND